MANAYSNEQIDQLLQRLSSDDKFRDAFQADPGDALKSAGLPDFHAACCRGKPLASKEALGKARQVLSTRLMAALDQNVHELLAR